MGQTISVLTGILWSHHKMVFFPLSSIWKSVQLKQWKKKKRKTQIKKKKRKELPVIRTTSTRSYRYKNSQVNFNYMCTWIIDDMELWNSAFVKLDAIEINTKASHSLTCSHMIVIHFGHETRPHVDKREIKVSKMRTVQDIISSGAEQRRFIQFSTYIVKNKTRHLYL